MARENMGDNTVRELFLFYKKFSLKSNQDPYL